MLWAGKLHRVLEAAQVVPSGDHVHWMPHRFFDPCGDLARGPPSFIVRWSLQSKVQRLALDLIEQKRRMGTAFPAVLGPVGPVGVVPRDGGPDPIAGALHDLRDLCSRPRMRGVAEKHQCLPTGAFVVRHRGFEPLAQFVQGQVGDDLDRFDSLSLPQNRMIPTRSRALEDA